MQVHAVNMDHMAKEAARIKKASKDKGDLPPLNWYNFSMGDTVIRLMPPWNATGFPFWRRSQHWELPPEKGVQYCLTETWPGKADLCFTCDELDKITAQFPDHSVGRQRASSQWLTNAVIRECPKDGTSLESKGPHIVTFSDGMYNWFVEQIQNPKIGGIAFDIEKGCDIKITKSQKKRKDGKMQTKYTMTFMPGVSPLHEDEKVVEHWCNNIVELDKVIRYPDDTKLIQYSAEAHKMSDWYVKKLSKSALPQEENDEEVVVGSAESRGADPTPSEADTPPEPEKKAESNGAAKEPVKSEALKPLQEDVPSEGFPDCYAGSDKPVAHEDGSFGFNEDLEKCMLCPHEMQCVAAKEQKEI